MEIGCCGAYCRTCCISVSGSNCLGCKLGYDSVERDINRSRYKIKLCCFRDRGLETCADCGDYTSYSIINGFYNKQGHKYSKYKQAIEYVAAHGYEEFLQIADMWKGPYGAYK